VTANSKPVFKTDLDLTTKDLSGLTSADALAAFLSRLGYGTGRRTVLTPSSLGLSGDTAASIRSIEMLSEDEDKFLRVLFVQPKSLTAKVRNDLIRILGRSNEDYLVILAATFDNLEFVLLDKKTKEKSGPAGGYKVQVVPKIFSVDRRKPSPQDVRTIRQFTWTHQDALDQFDKLRVVFDNAIFTGEFFQNRGLFSETTEELSDIYEATLTLLYRLLFLLYAESRDLLPVREGPYGEASLKKIKEEIAAKAGISLEEVDAPLEKTYSGKETALHDRLETLFKAMDKGDPVLNVPTYNGGLFSTTPDATDDRDHRIARFLRDHKVPDRYLAKAIDRLARDQDEKTLGLVFIDFKSLEVRHLGSIYEGLLEFKLKVADEDLTTQTEKNREKYIPLSKAKTKRGKAIEAVVKKGEVYLSNDKAERKASGAYYTPDPIVEYIVAQTVGPIIDEKLEALRPEFRKVRKTFDNELQKATAFTPPGMSSNDKEGLRRFAIEKTYHTHKDLVERLFDIKVLDPAMGSGHFLVEAVDRITDKLLQFLSAFPINPVAFHLERTRSSILESLSIQGVTVVRDKLTDINLLKRHVLKRCIYGVDLNPMAVELAKVSLWLDAFTLGAPLSFLDHHLRCGNSLVGATLADLEAATSGRLFGLDYGPLLEAIKFVLFVSKVADATAAEVADSISRYSDARKLLSGYQIVLDLVLAEHFSMPKAKALVSSGSDLDLSGREALLASLHGDNEKKLVAEVESLAKRPDLRFFHWEIEFPEVFTGFFDPNQTKIMHKDRIKKGSAGFDVVIGNPPYVRQEALKPIKEYLKERYTTFDSANDLYIYFQEMEIVNLRVRGRMGMIVANKWMRAGYGERLREFLLRTGQPLQVIDFGHAPIFPDADTFPCILLTTKRQKALMEKESPSDAETMAACEVPREHWHDRMDLASFVVTRRHPVPTRLLRREGWSLEDSRVQSLLEKVRRVGQRLGDLCKCSPLSGIKTGFNDAFVIDATTRSRLIADDKGCCDLIRPLLRGRDMERFRCRRSGMFLIAIPSSENHDWPWSGAETRAEQIFKKTFPSVANHLFSFHDALVRRQDQGRFWWELRSCDYWSEFDGAKLVWQEMAWFTRFAIDYDRQLVLNTAYVLPSVDPLIMCCLNSPLAWWYMWRTAQHGKDEVLRLIRDYTEEFPIPAPDSGTKDQLEKMTAALVRHGASINEFEAAVVKSVLKTVDCQLDSAAAFELITRPSEKFVERLAKLSGLARFEPPVAKRLIEVHRHFKTDQKGLLSRQLTLERELSTLVESAYGLTEEERSLVRSTRPPRDPLDVLEAKIEGRIDSSSPTQEPGE
jgi:type I restriction-modification system DNA methylase subunit